MLQLTSVHEAALNAIEEAIRDLPLERVALSRYNDSGHCYVHADVGNHLATGSAQSLVEAARLMLVEANEIIRNPPAKPLREAKQVKEAALALVDELRSDWDDSAGRTPAMALDDLADRIAALPVKE